ncbi:MAG: fibronectin type III-like domain-contianing protein, partial [Bacteroidales bacterium]|nr:fibronectin type III-like domain-contianing protein [Bacteroidales bacterium]
GNAYTISFDICNTGKTDGAEVAQVYVGAVDPKVVRPVKELKGYEKVYLKKGEKKNVKITLSDEAFHYYDVVSKQFVVAPGDYRIFVGSSSRDTELGPATVTIAPSGN